MVDIKKRLRDYIDDVSKCIHKSDFDILAKIVERLIQVKIDGKTIFTIGNGGSASTASHFCNDLLKGCRVEGNEGFKAICLNDSNAIITCLANDFSYKDIFSIQLKTFASKGDLLVAFSGSGNSPNIISALQTAREIGIDTIGFSGRDGGKMKDLCDILLIAPSFFMEKIEDMHLIYEHAMISSIRDILAQTLLP